MNIRSDDDDDDDETELEHFDDFTLASSWERFISEIEAVCRRWLADGPSNLLEKGAVLVGTSKTLHKAKYELKYDKKSYCMEYYFEVEHNDKVVNWDFCLQDLQLAFGVSEFLRIAPQSVSGVVLDSPEASKLLSAIAIALSNCNSLWPAFVPVHDPSRKAHIGIQNMGTVFTRRFESECIRSQVPVKLMHLEGLYELFVSKFAFSMLDSSMHLFRVQFTMKLTYKTLTCDDDNDDDDYLHEFEAENIETGTDARVETHRRSQWDDDCPWSVWFSAEDPVKGFELVTIWSERTIESSLEMAEIENSSPHEAENWLLLPTLSKDLNEGQKVQIVGFSSQLSLLVDALKMSFQAQFVEDFVSDSSAENVKPLAAIPPPTVVDRVLKELFHEGQPSPYPCFSNRCTASSVIYPKKFNRVYLNLPTTLLIAGDFSGKTAAALSEGENKSSRAIKGAPLESLFAQFCLHSLWFGSCNVRAIAILWIEFVREVRWYWEESEPLPRTPVDGAIDLSACLIHQKLQMLAICIERKREANPEFYDATGDKEEVKEDASSPSQEDPKFQEEFPPMPAPDELLNKATDRWTQDGVGDTGETHKDVNAFELASDQVRRGSAGVAGSLMLLGSHQRMHAPFTQDAPLMTEDMHEERLHAVAAFGDSPSFSAQLEREILSSDMSAFKAANPDAVFEDFIRWHSPGDWESDFAEESEVSVSESWPPKGRLSTRMSEQGNLWRKLWNDASALPADEQKPLLDPNREGEKILHYLETLRPHQLLEQMICTASRAAADTLNQSFFGNLSQMKSKLDQLYLTLASMLRPLQAGQVSQDSEIFEDLKRLVVVFEHIERLTITAASLHRKFINAPRLCSLIFTDYYKHYLPKMGKGSVEANIHEELDLRQQVGINERSVVADLFSPPSPNQSWRKVLSMGNLLNGHEPVVREIIFTMRDDVSGNHYAAHIPVGSQQETETYRMYIQGTSNDLNVALSVVSFD